MQNSNNIKTKRLDDRINELLQSGFQNHHRSILFLVGQNSSQQLPLLFQIFKQKSYGVPQLAWCYNDIDGFRSMKKRLQKRLNEENNNNSNDFLELNKVRYVHYRDVGSLLGRTFDFLVLQDLGKITPNILAQTIETVRGGGIIVFLVTTISDIELMKTGWQGNIIDGEDFGYLGESQGKPRFLRRLVRLINTSDRLMVLTDELDILSDSQNQNKTLSTTEITTKQKYIDGTTWRSELKKVQIPQECGLDERQIATLETLAGLAATADQQRCFLDIATALVRAETTYSKALQEQRKLNAEENENSDQNSENEESGDLNIQNVHDGSSDEGELTPAQKKREEQQLRMLQKRNKKLYDELMRLRDGDKTAFTGRGRLQTQKVVQTGKQLQGRYFISAGRGRGKSALLGLLAAACLSDGAAVILLVAPYAGNVQAVFEFAGKGLQALGYTDGVDFQLKTASDSSDDEKLKEKDIEQLILWSGGRRTLRFIPAACFGGQRVSMNTTMSGAFGDIQNGSAAMASLADIVLIDEAAAFKAQKLQSIFEKSAAAVAASTVDGYEGSGRVLQLKVLKIMQSAQNLIKLTLSEPIRYAPGDGIEKWLNKLLILNNTEAGQPPVRLPAPKDCTLSMVSRDTLFSAQKLSETFLSNIWQLFIASHYKNQPDDLKLLSDGERQRLFILHGPPNAGELPIPLCAIQVALEGGPRFSDKNVSGTISGDISQGAGDIVPRLLAQQYLSQDFAELRGVRVVRIAVTYMATGRGYGSRALELLSEFLASPAAVPEQKQSAGAGAAPLLFRAPRAPLSPADWGAAPSAGPGPRGRASYVAASFGLTGELQRFWGGAGFAVWHLGAAASQDTGAHNCVVVKELEPLGMATAALRDFAFRAFTLAETFFRDIDAAAFAAVLGAAPGGAAAGGAQDDREGDDNRRSLSPAQLRRLSSYYKRIVDYAAVADIVKLACEVVFLQNGQTAHDVKQHLVLSQMQILAGVGVQRKTFAEVARELNIKADQCQAIFMKAIGVITGVLESAGNSSK